MVVQQLYYYLEVVVIKHNKLAVTAKAIIIVFVEQRNIKEEVEAIKMVIKPINEHRNYKPEESN